MSVRHLKRADHPSARRRNIEFPPRAQPARELARLGALLLGDPLIVHIALGEQGFVLPIPAAEPGAKGLATPLQPAAQGDGGRGLAGLDHEALAPNR